LVVIVREPQSICHPSNGTVIVTVFPLASTNSSVLAAPLVTQIARATSDPVGDAATRSIADTKDV